MIRMPIVCFVFWFIVGMKRWMVDGRGFGINGCMY
jgi:hypothetical protein